MTASKKQFMEILARCGVPEDMREGLWELAFASGKIEGRHRAAKKAVDLFVPMLEPQSA